MLIKKREITELSANVRKLIDGQSVDIRDDREGAFAKLRNDIHTLIVRRNEEVAALQKERDAFKTTLADVSHQIKTPLTSIGIMTDLLENALEAGITPAEKQAEFTANIRKSLDRVEWLVSNLLKMAKLEAGAIDFKIVKIPSKIIIEKALEPLTILLELKNQRIEAAGGADVVCDERWTAEALTNVIKNASEHSPAGGGLRIEAGENPICAWIGVTDSGPGVKRAEIAGLFKRFQGSRSETGYGIGLPLALSIMKRQGGDIEVENAERGARFTLKFYSKSDK